MSDAVGSPRSLSERGRSRMAELARRYSLSTRTEEALSVLATVLANDPTAPTTVREEASVLDYHLADSLVALELPAVSVAGAIADLGSGAGLPGLALAIALPEAESFLIESQARKCQFLERAVRACGLPNVRVVNRRAEAWAEGLGRCDLVTARALGPLPIVEEYAAPLLRISGTLVIWRGARDPDAEAAGELAASELGLEVAEPIRVHPFPDAQHRHLHLISKVRDTPERFPRRHGVARKRPLGGSI